MRATVLSDAALAKHAGRFVWLSIDTENPANVSFVQRAAIEGYPSFLVVDPTSEDIVLRWLGSLTVAQLEELLGDGERAVAQAGSSEVERALARADRLGGAGRTSEAAEGYAEALRAADTGSRAYERAVESLVVALATSDQPERCATTAAEHAAHLSAGPSLANVVASGVGCALHGPEGAPWRERALATLEPLVRNVLAEESVLADDRSSLYALLVRRHELAGDRAAARRVAGEWLDFLEARAAVATDAETRAAFDSHRVGAALALGDPGRALPALLASERDLPQDYNPPARLAVLYRELGRWEEGLAATQRALDRCYGPRKLRVYETRVELFERAGDAASARRTIEEALAYAAELPEAQRPAGLVEMLRARGQQPVSAQTETR